METHKPSSYYVRRWRESDGRYGWIGPIRSPIQADKECNAWKDSGWSAEVLPSTPAVKREVAAWVKSPKPAFLSA